MADHYWWRFRFTAAQSGTDLHLATLKVRRGGGIPDIPLAFTNALAPYVTATGDSNNVQKLFDTDSTSGWQTGVTVDIIIRFQRQEWIGEFDLQQFSTGVFGGNRLDKSPKDFTLSWSDDGVSFTTQNTYTGVVWTSLGQTQTFVGTSWTAPPDEAQVSFVSAEMPDGGGSLSKSSVALVGLEILDGAGSTSRAAIANISLETVIGPPVTQAWVAFLGLEVIIGPVPNRRAINGPVQIIGG